MKSVHLLALQQKSERSISSLVSVFLIDMSATIDVGVGTTRNLSSLSRQLGEHLRVHNLIGCLWGSQGPGCKKHVIRSRDGPRGTKLASSRVETW